MTPDGLINLDRMVRAVDLVHQRLKRATQALEQVDIPYSIIGGNAVFLWMVKHGAGGERFTPNVDLLVNRADNVSIEEMLQNAGFFPDPERSDLFRDGANGSPRTRLRLVFAGEKVRETDLLDVELIDATLKSRYPSELAERLQALIDTPDG